MHQIFCSICGNNTFHDNNILWDGLVKEWQLSPIERAYIDRQQGCACQSCGANLRINALAKAICNGYGPTTTLQDLLNSGRIASWNILDCNGAISISDALSQLPNYIRANYPEHDMHDLAFDDQSFDLVIHSDTLEHVANPVAALRECRRVLKPNGRLCFTVPIIVGRMSRNRTGLPPSYHGDPQTSSDDFVVQSEFGADVWTLLFEAGFAQMSFTQVEYPSGIAITAWGNP
jgi:SAM-dependent methyltransferase